MCKKVTKLSFIRVLKIWFKRYQNGIICLLSFLLNFHKEGSIERKAYKLSCMRAMWNDERLTETLARAYKDPLSAFHLRIVYTS